MQTHSRIIYTKFDQKKTTTQQISALISFFFDSFFKYFIKNDDCYESFMKFMKLTVSSVPKMECFFFFGINLRKMKRFAFLISFLTVVDKSPFNENR